MMLSLRRSVLGQRPGRLAITLALLATSACTAVGPSRSDINKAPVESALHGIEIIDINQLSVQRLRQAKTVTTFAQGLGNRPAIGTVIRPGDVLEISIWEAPPAALFGISALQSSVETSRSTALPEFLVGPSGQISVPFAGVIKVAERTLPQIEQTITQRLTGKAHLPQVMVRLLRNATANVTIVGEVLKSDRMPLTPKGERLLDALAAAGGTRQPVNKMTIQVTRNGQIFSMPLSEVIRDPAQNVTLQTDDVVTALYQPYSFTVLGATGRNDEVNFEATGLTLAQAVGRIGGLQDGRADPKGVFLFRWEAPEMVPDRRTDIATDAAGRIPVVYRIDMKDPATYFLMQNFEVHDRDIMYVSNGPISEFQRFIGLIASSVLPVVTVDNALRTN